MNTRKGGMRCRRWMYFVSIYENRRMKPLEIVLRRREGEEGEHWRGKM
jgi:hypothetical protein